MHSPFLVVFILSVFCNIAFGQRVTDSKVHQEGVAKLDSLETKAKYYSDSNPSEKVYLHFDKPYYVLGEDSWYKAYVVHSSDFNPTDISSVLYVDWIDPSGKIIKHQRLRIENGAAACDFAIGRNLLTGSYTVRAYTNWMRNNDPALFFSTTIQIFDLTYRSTTTDSISNKSAIDLQFFPEGGTFVAGIKTQLAFKAIGRHGKGMYVKGNIVDDQNNFVTGFNSTHGGMGIIPFTPKTNRSYCAVLQNGETYSLPPVASEGLTLAASALSDKKISVRVEGSRNYLSSTFYVLAQSRGFLCYSACMMLENTTKDFSILTNDLPEGVLQLTLFDSKGIPRCERSVFVRKTNKIDMTVLSEQQKFSARDSIRLNVSVKTSDGKPFEATLSMSVTDGDFVNVDLIKQNIYTYLLLQSDIKGNVENPAWYFESDSRDRSFGLELVMLTHGWTRYNWENILSPSVPAVAFTPELGVTIAGKILAKNKPVPNAPFMVIVPQSSSEIVGIYETDSLGQFLIPDLHFTDSALVAWRVMRGRKGTIQEAKVQLHPAPELPKVNLTHHYLYDPEVFNRLFGTFTNSDVVINDSAVVLKEIVIEATKTKIIPVGMSSILVKPDSADLTSSVTTASFIGRYAMRLPMMQMVKTADGIYTWGFPVRGRVVPFSGLSINGNFIDTTDGQANPFLVLDSIPLDEIDYVIIDGMNIAVWTKDPPSQTELATVRQMVKGYDKAREFYHPKYHTTDKSGDPDNRLTLYWNPHLKTDENGRAAVDFYNNDSTKRLFIVIEGIVNGHPAFLAQVVGTNSN